MRKVCLLGASGNIGSQTLDVLSRNRNRFILRGVSIGKRVGIIDELLRKFPSIERICVQKEEDFLSLSNKYKSIRFYCGDEGLLSLLNDTDAEMVINALVGFVGLLPSIRALELGKILCLANKESLVVGGDYINDLLSKGQGRLYPIDSEHVAIAKCLKKVDKNDVERILITASGGAFRDYSREELKKVTVEDALSHPTWSMGKKITIDSDTMFNKGFEIIEASVLFSWPIEKIEPLIHLESNLHSALLLKDGSYVGEVNKPDMRGPIAYALFEGEVPLTDVKHVDKLSDFGPFHYREFSYERYPAVKIAIDAYNDGKIHRAVLNAAVEECDYLFLEGKIPFYSFEECVSKMLSSFKEKPEASLRDILIADKQTRERLRLYSGE